MDPSYRSPDHWDGSRRADFKLVGGELMDWAGFRLLPTTVTFNSHLRRNRNNPSASTSPRGIPFPTSRGQMSQGFASQFLVQMGLNVYKYIDSMDLYLILIPKLRIAGEVGHGGKRRASAPLHNSVKQECPGGDSQPSSGSPSPNNPKFISATGGFLPLHSLKSQRFYGTQPPP